LSGFFTSNLQQRRLNSAVSKKPFGINTLPNRPLPGAKSAFEAQRLVAAETGPAQIPASLKPIN
jgi:hypothetical protein